MEFNRYMSIKGGNMITRLTIQLIKLFISVSLPCAVWAGEEYTAGDHEIHSSEMHHDVGMYNSGIRSIPSGWIGQKSHSGHRLGGFSRGRHLGGDPRPTHHPRHKSKLDSREKAILHGQTASKEKVHSHSATASNAKDSPKSVTASNEKVNLNTATASNAKDSANTSSALNAKDSANTTIASNEKDNLNTAAINN